MELAGYIRKILKYRLLLPEYIIMSFKDVAVTQRQDIQLESAFNVDSENVVFIFLQNTLSPMKKEARFFVSSVIQNDKFLIYIYTLLFD